MKSFGAKPNGVRHFSLRAWWLGRLGSRRTSLSLLFFFWLTTVGLVRSHDVVGTSPPAAELEQEEDAPEPQDSATTQKTPSDDASSRALSGKLPTPVYRINVTAPVQEGNEIDRYGSLITTVSQDQIRDLNAYDLATAVRRVPGVTISRYNLVGSYGGADGGAVFVRGHGSGRPGSELTVLVAGAPRFVGVWSHPLLDHYGIESAHRIRIYKSAQPVLFGGGSFATLEIDPFAPATAGWSLAAESAAGEHGTWLQRVQAVAGGTGYSLSLSAGFRRSGGHRSDSGGQSWSAGAALVYDLSPTWRLVSYLDHANGWAQDPGPVGGPARGDVPAFRTDDEFMVFRLERRTNRWEGTYGFYWDNGAIDWLQWDGTSFRSLTDYDNFGFRVRESTRLWDAGEFLFGLDVDSYGGKSREVRPGTTPVPGKFRFRDLAPYVMVSHTWTRGWRLTPSFGVRYNRSRDFGGDWAPQAGLTFERASFTGYVDYAHSFNLPGVWAAVNYASWGRGEAYRELRPEILDHYEVGFLHALHSGIRWGVSLFHDDVRDAVRFVPPPPPPPQFANLGSYRITGAEVTVEAVPQPSLVLFGGWTFLNPEPGDLPNAPRWSWTGGVSWLPLESLRLHGDVQWTDRRHVLNPRTTGIQAAVDAFLLANCQLVVLPAAPVELFFAIENLTNTEYEYRPGYPMPGRTWFGGLRWRWSQTRRDR
ncbi:MAG TPA: TonB-dependent receptor plug domain-containing protein [Acidobacteriota bacterium]|jgi:iron complex outermembrane receptor protein|nr:TonB-dependent receptor plug domain-containing protein [Acidobacteriota bacterium]HRR25324.1 TonB-dependent receptor plug domain-containing protein [Acidobacteriota bacterium]HRV07246.1 TonB-dependent receptor plug domain-containing protein [Acidobacteriota bacterium]